MTYRQHAFALLVTLMLVACADATPSIPRLTGVTPATVTTLSGITLSIEGENLFGFASGSFDNRSAPVVDETWSVQIGSMPALDATLIDSGQLRVELPAGVAPNTYDISAVAPDGRVARLANALNVVAEPVGLAISIETASGGQGTPLGATVIEAGTAFQAFAVLRDNSGVFLSDVEVLWSLSQPIGSIVAGPGTSTSFQGEFVGTGAIEATHTSADSSLSGTIEVRAGTASQIAVEDADDGTGSPVGDLPNLSTDDNLELHAVSRDAFGNFAGLRAVPWTSTGTLQAVPSEAQSSLVVALSTPGIGTVLISDATLGSADTGTFTVVPGKAQTLEVSPDTLTVSADEGPRVFSVTAIDADGNATFDLGAITWSVASGPITSINSTTGAFDPSAAGTGSIRATSSHGPSDDTGEVSVVPGIASAVAIAPNTANVTADTAPFDFTVVGTDADGNPTSDVGTLLWSVASGSITAINPTTGEFTPTRAGSGTISVISALGPSAVSGAVAVAPGQAVNLAVSPDTVTASPGDADTNFAVAANDADGNATTTTGVITWSVSNVASIDSATGVFTPTTPGVGNVTATSSLGISDDSGTVHVLGGLEVVDILHPAVVVPGTKGVPLEVHVRNGFTEAIPLTGISLTFDALGDVSDEYFLFPAPGTALEIAAGQTEAFVYMVGIDGTASLGSVSINAEVEAFIPSAASLERASLSDTWLVNTGTPVAPELSAPVVPNNRICLGDTISFDGSSSTGTGALGFLWDLDGSTPGSSTSSVPSSIAYPTTGSFPYSLTVTDTVSQAIRFGSQPIYVGSVAGTPTDHYATGSISFLQPTQSQAIDMDKLPKAEIDQDTGTGVAMCDGNDIDVSGHCYLTLFSDRGTLDVTRDIQPALAGIQVELHECTHFDDVDFDNDPAQLEGTGMLYAEYRDESQGVVTASGFVGFRMTNDLIPPTVDATAPTAPCTSPCYGKDQRLLFKFSEPMDESTIVAGTRVAISSASTCGGTFSDITVASSILYNAETRSVSVVPEVQPLANYSVRISFATTVTDNSSNANTLTPFTQCFVLEDQGLPPTPVQPTGVALSVASFSPDGDGVSDAVTITMTADVGTTAVTVAIRRGTTEVRTILEPTDGAGNYNVVWDGRDNEGRTVPNGHYALYISTENAVGASSSPVIRAVGVESAISFVGVPPRF